MINPSEPYIPTVVEPSRVARDGKNSPPAPDIVMTPQIRLMGRIDDALLQSFQQQLGDVADGDGPIAVELMTFGGDAEIGRRLALEVRLAKMRLKRRLIFLGKTMVYSAGVTAMAGFGREDRFLTRDAVLLIHCRQLEQTVQLNGPLRINAQRLQEVMEEIKMGLEVERDGFNALIEGSDVSLEEVNQRAATNWYVPADEALKRKLVAGLV